MADVYTYVDNTGTIVPNTAEIQAEVQDEFRVAFGQDLNVDPSTPQGVLITTETLARTAVADNNVAVANQINPNLAGGVFLDAILALTGGERTPATFTTVTATLIGVAGSIVPAGSLAQSVSTGVQYGLVADVIIPGDGVFVAQMAGPTPVPASDLTIIITPVVGWETVSNAAAQTSLGTDLQSDVSARSERIQTLALQGMAMSEAIISALIALAAGISLTYRENVGSSPANIDGVVIPGHSIYICIDPGINMVPLLTIATTILAKKSGGCGFASGGSSHPQNIAVTDPYSGQVYQVMFDTPNTISITMVITITAGAPIPNVVTAVQDAILAYINGDNNEEPGFAVGQYVSPYEIAGAINEAYPQIFVRDVTVAKTGNSQQHATIPIAIFEKAFSPGPAAIVVNQIT